VILTHGSISYSIGAIVASNEFYRIYLCNDGIKQYLLQIASDVKHNGGLDRATYILNEFKDASDVYETEYAKFNPGRKLSYDQLFPAISDSFISHEQGGRRINILSPNNDSAIDKMVPLSNLLKKDKLRISLETSGWIMGRLLKLLDFSHRQGISINIYDNNILINPKEHYVIVFDWSTAQTHQDVPIDICKLNITNAAKTVFTALGGDIETGKYTYEDNNRYIEFLWSLTKSVSGDAEKVHHDFYEIVDSVFGVKFYPFKALPL